MNVLSSAQSWVSFSIQSIQTHFGISFLFQHKKIAAIVAIALIGLASCYLICRHYIFKDKKVVVLEDNERILEDVLPNFLSTQETNLQRFSSSLITLQNIVEQYKQLQKEWKDLTDYTEEELDQLLSSLNLSLGRKEFESTESLHFGLEAEFQLYRHRFKDAFEIQQSVQDLNKQFHSKAQEFQLLKVQAENHQKQQKNFIQCVHNQQQKLIDAKYHRKVQAIQDRKTQAEQNIIEDALKELQKQEQDFLDSLINLTRFLNEYSSRYPQPLNLPATKEALDGLRQTVSQNIALTKRYVHEVELKKIKINAGLAIHQAQHNHDLQNLGNHLKVKIADFEQLKVKALFQEKEQLDLIERLFEQEKRLADQEHAQSMQKCNQDKQQFLRKTKEGLDAMERQSKEAHAELIKLAKRKFSS